MKQRRLIVTAVVIFGVTVFLVATQWLANKVAEAQPPNAIVYMEPVPASAIGAISDALPQSAKQSLTGAQNGVLGEKVAELCVVFLEPTKEGATAVAEANDEHPSFWCGDENSQPSWVSDRLAASVTVYKLYSDTDKRGSQLWGVSPYSCGGGNIFVTADLNTIGWANIASSAEAVTGAGCSKVTLWDSPYFSGALIACTSYCAGFGAMNNAAESVESR